MRIINDSDLKQLDSVQLGREYSGSTVSFDDDGIVIVASHKQNNSCFVAVSVAGKSMAYLINEPFPILVPFLTAFRAYTQDVKDRIQELIRSWHSPTYNLLAEHKEVFNDREYRQMESFSFCSNIELQIDSRHEQLFFSAVTGPSRGWSEGTVMGICHSGRSNVLRLSNRGRLRLDDTFLVEEYSAPVLRDFQTFLDRTDK